MVSGNVSLRPHWKRLTVSHRHFGKAYSAGLLNHNRRHLKRGNSRGSSSRLIIHSALPRKGGLVTISFSFTELGRPGEGRLVMHLISQSLRTVFWLPCAQVISG